MLGRLEQIGRGTARGLDEVGHAAGLFGESIFWALAGRHWRQPVRAASVAAQMLEVGLRALPIVTLLTATVGMMLAIQGIYTLGLFGAESYVHVGVAFSVTREFAPLIVAILIAGRSGSALAARLSTMTINQEVDALRVIGIDPVRFLVAPALLAMMIMLPALTMWANVVSLVSSGLYASAALDISLSSYLYNTIDVLGAGDLWHGLGKSLIFAVLIVLIGVVNGARVTGGAEGVGRATTRSVVQGISAIVVTDMVFALAVV